MVQSASQEKQHGSQDLPIAGMFGVFLYQSPPATGFLLLLHLDLGGTIIHGSAQAQGPMFNLQQSADNIYCEPLDCCNQPLD